MVDTAVQLIQQVGPGAVSYKSGVEHAYKLIPIHMDDVPALGIKLFDDWLWDTTLPMGSRSGCAIFEAFSTALQYIAEYYQRGMMCHVLDDFLLLTEMGVFLSIYERLGILMVVAKTEKGTCLVFLGVELDTIAMQA